MAEFYWIAIVIAGVAVMFVASRKAVFYASALAHGLAIPPFLIGVTLISIGTDIPEIANSIVASIAQHGDLVVGDSVGSVMTQITLVFGLLPFFAGKIEIDRVRTAVIGVATIIALATGIFLFTDGHISRIDAIVLAGLWFLFTGLSWKFAQAPSELVMPMPSRQKVWDAFLVIFFLTLVGVGAGAFVKGVIELSAEFGIPEYLISFFGSSLGTSLPELAVDVTALRTGKRDFAIGDVVGSCFVDSTLSMAAGPLIAPIAVTASLAVQGSLIAILAVAIATITVSIWRHHGRWTGAFLLLVYMSVYLFAVAN